MSNDFTSRLVEAYKAHLGNKLISIALFGSRARGDYTKSSDFDIFIIAKSLPGRHLAKMGRGIWGKVAEVVKYDIR